MRKFFYLFLVLTVSALGTAIFLDVQEPEKTNLVILAFISLIITILFARAIKQKKKPVFYLVHDVMHDIYYITDEASYTTHREITDEIIATATSKENLHLLRDAIYFNPN
jgi:hypothetical protein